MNERETIECIISSDNSLSIREITKFYKIFLELLKIGVAPAEIIKNWNDSNKKFENKVYLKIKNYEK